MENDDRKKRARCDETQEENKEREAEKERESTYWKDLCINSFCLKPCLAEQQQPDNEDDEIWQRYYEYRCKHNPEDAKREKDDDLDTDYEDDLQNLVRRKYHSIARDLGEAGQDWIHSTYPVVLDVEFDDDGSIRTGKYHSYIFSPYQIPQAIEFTHRYHHRTRYNSVEFSAFWAFKLVRFDGKPPGDETQRKLAKYFPKGILCEDALYDGDDEFEYLCWVTCDDPPNEQAPWTFVPKFATTNLNPTTLRRLRDWLYGIPAFSQSRKLVSDFDLMHLLFASAALPNFECLMNGDLGYTWRLDMDDPAFQHLAQQGYATDDTWPKVSWLEYQVRLVTGSLREIDHYYQPFDALAVKSEWGMEALENTYRNRDVDFDSEEEDDDRYQAPWLLWDEPNRHGDGISGNEDMGMMLANLLAHQMRR